MWKTNQNQDRYSRLILLSSAALAVALVGGCGGGQAGQEGPPVSEAQREQVRTTGTVLPPPSQPEAPPQRP